MGDVSPVAHTSSVTIEAAGVTLPADLTVPQPAAGEEPPGDRGRPEMSAGVVLFAHGSGSSRHSPRNRLVAARLIDSGFATLLADLLTPEEERYDAHSGALRFDIELLATRMTALVDWSLTAGSTLAGADRRAASSPAEATRRLPVGLFGASTGAAAALVAAAQRPAVVGAVVSRGGRPDLAGEALAGVRAPVLLIVGERDRQVLVLNEQAAAQLTGPHQLQIVPAATHLFEEPGALPQVADHAAGWFGAHLR